MKNALELLVQRVHGAISEGGVALVLSCATRCDITEGALVTGEGDVDTALYFVERGDVEIVGVEDDGTHIVYAVLGPGEFIGEVGFVDGLPRTRSVRAQTDVVLWRLGREDIDVLDAEARATFFQMLSMVLARRFRDVVGSGDPVTPNLGSKTTDDLKRMPQPWTRKGSTLRDALNEMRPLVESIKEEFYELQRQTGRHRVLGGSMPSRDARVDALLDRMDRALREAGRLNEGEGLGESRLLAAIGGYIRRDLYAHLMASHLAERIYLKPKGLNTDYMVLEQIYHNRPSGEGWLGTLVDRWLLNTPMMTAMRQRRSWMTRVLDRESTRLYLGEPSGYSMIDILALGLGSGRELFDFVNGCQFSERLNLTCMDVDIEALTYANTSVNVGQHQATVRFVRDSVAQFVRDDASTAYGAKDIIYISTLADTLSNADLVRVVRRCRRLLKPRGLLYVANLSTDNPQRYFASSVLEWPLHHRTADELGTVVADGFGEGDIQVQLSRDGVDIRVTARAGERVAGV